MDGNDIVLQRAITWQTSGGCNDKGKTIHAQKSLVQNETVCHKLWAGELLFWNPRKAE